MLRTSWRLFLRTKRVFFPALLAGVGDRGICLLPSGSLFRLHGDVLWFAGDLQQALRPLFLLELYLSYEFLRQRSGKAAWRRRPRPSPGGRPGSTPRPGRSSSAWRLYSF